MKIIVVFLLLSVLSVANAWDQRNHGRNAQSSPYSPMNLVVRLKLLDPTATDGRYRVSSPSLSTADCFISEDNGAWANCTNVPVWQGNGTVSVTLTAAELDAAFIEISLIDQSATKEWVDTSYLLVTGGSCGAMFQTPSSPCNPAP